MFEKYMRKALKKEWKKNSQNKNINKSKRVNSARNQQSELSAMYKRVICKPFLFEQKGKNSREIQ